MQKRHQKRPKIFFHENDLPEWVEFKESVAIDTEAMGLHYGRDRLCLVQLSFDGENCHIIQIKKDEYQKSDRLIKLLEDEKVKKIFHFARFDVGLIFSTFGVLTRNIYCTKIASKLARTYTERHGLKSVCMELLGVEISKKEQSSDWGKNNLTEDQKAYAASDVLYLHEIMEALNKMLEREGRDRLALEAFNFLPTLAELDCSGWSESLFAHL